MARAFVSSSLIRGSHDGVIRGERGWNALRQSATNWLMDSLIVAAKNYLAVLFRQTEKF
jgi:hypothetical protein